MGVQVWRLREGPAVAAADGVVAVPPAPASLPAATAGPVAEAGGPATAAGAAGATGAGIQAGALSDPARPPAAGDDPAAMDWERLQAAVAACRACALCETRTQTVFGVGARGADLMVVGEAPGADEDRQGEPFVGRAGRLLNLMLAAIGLRREQVYIANVLKCRPPGNRVPLPEEAQHCEPFLLRQIVLVEPRVLLAVGWVAARNLLKTDAAMGDLRGRWFELSPGRIPVMVTYHPSYLLRTPEQKGKAWRDLQQVARRLRVSTARSADPVAE
jgi:DNA polymerase